MKYISKILHCCFWQEKMFYLAVLNGMGYINRNLNIISKKTVYNCFHIFGIQKGKNYYSIIRDHQWWWWWWWLWWAPICTKTTLCRLHTHNIAWTANVFNEVANNSETSIREIVSKVLNINTKWKWWQRWWFQSWDDNASSSLSKF